MSEEKHTPGPWSYFHDTCAQCEKDGTAEYVIQGPPGAYHGQFSHEPDARLIAAAPDMLEALKKTVLQLQYLADKFGETGTGAAVLAHVNAAIAKATRA